MSTSGSGPAPRAARTAVPPVPGALRWIFYLLVGYIVLLVALPLQMTINRGALAGSITSNTPNLDLAYLGFAVAAALVYSWGFHAVSAALTIWFVAKASKGRPWARIALTVYLVFASAASLVSAAAGAEYLWAVIPSNVLHIVMLVLLWAPASVRQFFAAHRAARTDAAPAS